MNFDHKLIICNQSDKEYLIKQNTELLDMKFISLKEIYETVFFTIKPSALYYVHKKYHLPLSTVKEILSYLYFLADNEISNQKLIFLKTIKKDLKEMGFIFDNVFKRNIFKRYECILYNLLPSKRRDILQNELEKYTKVFFYEKESLEREYSLFQSLTKEEEFSFICKEISQYLAKGYCYEDISIMNVKENDYSLLKKLSHFYHLNISLPAQGSILNAEETQNFLALLTVEDNFSLIIEKLQGKNHFIINKLISYINDYELMDVSPVETFDFFKYLLSETKYQSTIYDHSIRLDNSLAKIIFYANFNEGLAPKIHKDEGYISNRELELLELDGIDELNKLGQKSLLRSIQSYQEVFLTCHLQEDGIKLNPSILVNHLKTKIIPIKHVFGFSEKMDKIYLASACENYLKYGVRNEDIFKYNLSFFQQKYDNSFKFKNKESYIEYFTALEKVVLSYSSMKKYRMCPFSYYLERILGITDYEENLGAKLGTFTHYMLEQSYSMEFSLEDAAKKYIEENLTDPKEIFYTKAMLEVVQNVISFNKEYESINALDLHELEIQVEHDCRDKFKFIGIIDKILYAVDEENVYVAIIDYKTSKYDFLSLENVEDGLNMQLPSYLYLLSKSGLFQDKKIHIVGIYLQKIIRQKYETLSDIKASFKLQGFSIEDPLLVSKLDSGYEKSNYIQSMSYKGKFGAYSKLIGEKDIAHLHSLVEKEIESMCQGIEQGDFPIKPIRVMDGVNACTWCGYADICYHKEEDYLNLNKSSYEREE